MAERLFAQVGFDQGAQQFVAIQLAHQAAGVVIGGDVGGVLGQDVPCLLYTSRCV